MRHKKAVIRTATAYMKLLFPHVLKKEDMNMDDFYAYCLKPAIHRRDIIRQQCSKIDLEGSFSKPMPDFSLKQYAEHSMDKIKRLQELYLELDNFQISGEDVVAEIRAQINDLELQILFHRVRLMPDTQKNSIIIHSTLLFLQRKPRKRETLFCQRLPPYLNKLILTAYRQQVSFLR